mmetsp:Transcript_15761/g.46708  ORF Transcript_15761/g.46708 Transcript_15761/m.46708 type:complete len:238 (+) Transcript_15761:1895-2608(+)
MSYHSSWKAWNVLTMPFFKRKLRMKSCASSGRSTDPTGSANFDVAAFCTSAIRTCCNVSWSDSAAEGWGTSVTGTLVYVKESSGSAVAVTTSVVYKWSSGCISAAAAAAAAIAFATRATRTTRTAATAALTAAAARQVLDMPLHLIRRFRPVVQDQLLPRPALLPHEFMQVLTLLSSWRCRRESTIVAIGSGVASNAAWCVKRVLMQGRARMASSGDGEKASTVSNLAVCAPSGGIA